MPFIQNPATARSISSKMGQCFSIADYRTGNGRKVWTVYRDESDGLEAVNKTNASEEEELSPQETGETYIQADGVLRAEPPYFYRCAAMECGRKDRVHLKITLSNGLVASISTRLDNQFGWINLIVAKHFEKQPKVHVGRKRFSPKIMAMY